YPVKRVAEKVELSVRSTSGSQGLFYLTLAGRRLTEAQAVGAAEATTQAELLRDYNIALGFAQAGLETGLTSTTLARAYDQTTDMLAANLTTLPTAPQNQLVLSVALELTGKVSARALALLVSAHRQGANGLPQAEVANRLTQEIAKVEAKLGHVDDKIKEFPSVRPAPRVVIESKSTVVPVAEASRQAKESLSEAKELVARNEFSLALQKVQESEDITQKSEAAVADEAVAGEEQSPLEGEVKGEADETTGEPAVPGEVSPESQPESGGAGELEAPVETPATP
ncbi:MAG: hypothetical protein U1C53_02010, partial [Candidatus Veblenbacteria bacterium]|nr:hypothetical protein [Candidatus Veblenbacteria bacterium]